MRQGEGAMSITSLGSAISRPASFSYSSSYTYLVRCRIGLATSSLLWPKNKPHHTNTKLKQKLRVKDSAQETPQELEEDSKFVPLDPQDPIFGPPVSFFQSLPIMFKSVIINNTFEYIFFCRFCSCSAFNFMKHKR